MSVSAVTFSGGVHMDGRKKLTEEKEIEKAKEPKTVYIPLHQHVGAPCKPLVKAKEEVKIGQKIGDTDASLTAPVHSSVSGTVKKIDEIYTPNGHKVQCIIIESDGLNEVDESMKINKNIEDLSKEEIENVLREAGIVGMGGAAFPMHSKFRTAGDIKNIVLNGAECEPYLTCDHRLMVEKSQLIVDGLKIMMRYFDNAKAYIGIEDNKKDAIEVMREAVKDMDNVEVVSLKTKFPQGDSYRLVNAVCKEIVPKGGRTNDVNTVVNNVGTVAAAAEAVLEGKPLYERVVTVTGNGIKEPKNLLVKIGTPIKDLIEECGGFNGETGKIIVGGPMTGFTQFSLDAPVTKGTTGVLVMTEEESIPDKILPCIKCGKCLEVCPVKLEPLYISAYALKDRFDDAEKLDALSCIECGSCSFICPAKRPLVETITHAKREITARRRRG